MVSYCGREGNVTKRVLEKKDWKEDWPEIRIQRLAILSCTTLLAEDPGPWEGVWGPPPGASRGFGYVILAAHKDSSAQ